MDKLAKEILEKYYPNDFGDGADIFKAMKEYHKAKMREELIEYEIYDKGHVWVEQHKTLISKCIDEYLKDKQ